MSQRTHRFSRRAFSTGALGGLGLASSLGCESEKAEKSLPVLPPKDARVQSTACAYCIVGCGYKAYSWPVEAKAGGPKAEDNALGVEFPHQDPGSPWISPQMHNIVRIDGKPHHLAIIPDPDTSVVNPRGNHSLGGSLASKLCPADSSVDRLERPQLRIGGQRYDISWDDAVEIIARVSHRVLETAGTSAWGMKTYSYQFYENTYAITKLALNAINTPCWAPHDKPRNASDAPGLTDAGINPFSAAYKDYKNAEVLFVSGVSLYDAHGVLFTSWVQGGPKLIVVNPRRDRTADYAEKNGGLFLQIAPGTDTLLHNSIAWVILSEGWEDSDFIAKQCADEETVGATSAEFDINNPQASSQVFNSTEAGAATLSFLKTNAALRWRRVEYGRSFSAYRDFILGDERHQPESAASIIGIQAKDIRRAAELIARPTDGKRPKTSFMLEKGNYWTHNYPNTASFVSLALLSGAGNRPGQVVSRAGGHQRGMMKGGSYPFGKSPHEIDGNKIGLNLDHWAMKGNLRFVWVIGCTWAGGGTAAAQALYTRLEQQTVGGALPQLEFDRAFPRGESESLDTDYVIQTLTERGEAGGMTFVQQDLYPQALTQLADLVLPAAGWGEAPFSRMQGERRLRYYPKLADPPGEAKPDWWIVGRVARKMGFSGFNWSDADDVFEAAGEASRGGIQDYWPLIRRAHNEGQSPTQVLASLGTEGIQCPVRREGDKLVGTVRLHETGFATPTGRALFVEGRWDEVLARQEALAPSDGEMWIINRRAPGTWNSMVEDYRNPYRINLWSENFVELHPEDLSRWDLQDGDRIWVINSTAVDEALANGSPESRFQGVVRKTDRVPPGIAYVHFNFLGEPQVSANSGVSNVPDPINGLYSFKLGKGRIEKVS